MAGYAKTDATGTVVLVTGGSGLVGKAIHKASLDELVEDCHQLLKLINLQACGFQDFNLNHKKVWETQLFNQKGGFFSHLQKVPEKRYNLKIPSVLKAQKNEKVSKIETPFCLSCVFLLLIYVVFFFPGIHVTFVLFFSKVQVVNEDDASKNETWIFLSSKDGDLVDRSATEAIFQKHKPTHVIHLAARVGGLFHNMAKRLGTWPVEAEGNNGARKKI